MIIAQVCLRLATTKGRMKKRLLIVACGMSLYQNMLYVCVDRSIEHRSVHSAVRLAAELLSALAGRSQYNGHVAHALSTLQMLQERLQVSLIKIKQWLIFSF